MNFFKRQKMLGAIADSFTKIHARDRRVTRINMPRDCFMELVTHRDSLSVMAEQHQSIITSPSLHKNYIMELGRINLSENFLRDGAQADSREQFPDTAGKIWGANVYFTEKKLEILSDDLRYRSGTKWPQIERMSPTITEPVNINLKFFLMNNITIHIKSRAKPFADISKAEATAIGTLREMITETDFRKYLKYGFILVKGQSGHIFQIFRDKAHTKIWKNGKVIKEVCVMIKDDNIPPTDNVIALKTIIETSEKEFEKLGNVYNMQKVA
jgi:hypothetical protein